MRLGGAGARAMRWARDGRGLACAFHVKVGGVDGRAGLLAPGFVQAARGDAVEAQLVGEVDDGVFGRRVIARYRDEHSGKAITGSRIR